MNNPLTVAIAEDNSQVCQAYCAILSKQSDLRLIGQAANGRSAVSLYQKHRPDVMLMDLAMPVMTGIEAIAAIRADHPNACIVALTSHATDTHIAAALRAGAAGYLYKDCDITELFQAIHDAYHRRMPLSSTIRHQVAQSYQDHPDIQPPQQTGLLTERETELLQCLAQGLTNRDIATRLGVVESSVKKYLSVLGKKLDARTRTHILARATNLGLIQITIKPGAF